MPTKFPAEGVEALVSTGGSGRRAIDRPAKYHPGQVIRAANINHFTHTRLPQYVRGKVGTIVEIRGTFLFPDAYVASHAEVPQHVYSVMFTAKDLWGAAATGNDALYIDLYEDYIESEAS